MQVRQPDAGREPHSRRNESYACRLPAAVGISTQMMCDIEKGRRMGSPPVCANIADVLERELKELCHSPRPVARPVERPTSGTPLRHPLRARGGPLPDRATAPSTTASHHAAGGWNRW